MKDCNRSEGKVTIGMDLSDRTADLCVCDEQGTKVEETKISLTEQQLRKRFGACEPARIALEAGTHSPWVSRLLKEFGHEVIVANPRELAMIFRSPQKNDRRDAECLARVARMDPQLLAPIQHRGAEAQADLALLRAREALVRTRTLLVNPVRGAVKSVGQRVDPCSTASFAKKVADQIPAELQPALEPRVKTIQGLTGQIRKYDEAVEQMGQKKYPETAKLRQVAGVGPLTSLAYVLTLEDPKRFAKSREVGAYLGLVPRQDQSGQRDPQMRISKAGDECLRRLLVGSAHYILGPFGPATELRRWGLELATRGGKSAKKRAVVAVARKLAVLLHRLWISAEDYQPNRRADQAPPKPQASVRS